MGLCRHRHSILIFFLSLTASWEIYSLSLHDALPISKFPFSVARVVSASARMKEGAAPWEAESALDRKSTRLNSSHGSISYAVFFLKKKNKRHQPYHAT